MAVKASDSITLFHQTDISSVTWYYLLQPSATTPPTKPTTDPPPSGWTTSEPTYTKGSTKSLYIVEKTVFSDGTFAYSDVSLSTSYEAAKAAYNKAVQSAQTATRYITDITDGIMVHPEGDSTSGWKITNVLEMLRNGVSYFWAGLVNSVVTLRLGPSNSGHVMIDDDSVSIMDGDAELAQFSATNATIGEKTGGSSYMELTPKKISAMSSDQTNYFEVGDTSGIEFSEEFTGDGSTTVFKIHGSNIVSASVDVTVNGESVDYSWIPQRNWEVRVTSAPPSGATVIWTYIVDVENSRKYFTFGTRKANYVPGMDSVSFGHENVVEGYCYAFGHNLITGFGTKAAYFGGWNDYSERQSDLLVVGNGSASGGRHNALRLDLAGNLRISGTISSEKYLLPKEDATLDPVYVRSGEITSLCDITLAAKTRYLIIYGAGFSTNAKGYRKLHLAPNSNSAGRFSPLVAAVSGEQTRMNASLVYTNPSASSIVIHLWAQHNAGVDLAVYGYYYLVQI